MFCFAKRSHRYFFFPWHLFSWSKCTRLEPSPSFSPSALGNLFMSLRGPVPYASQPGNPRPSGLGLGDNMKTNSNKQSCVSCTIWPLDTYVVDLCCLGWGICFGWCKPITQERRLCRAHLVGECVLFIARVTRRQGVLGAFGSSNSSFGVGPQGLVPVLRTFAALQASQWHLCLQVARRMLSCGLLIFILHQYLVIGRWPLLTSVIWRHKHLIHMTCKSAPDYLGVIQDTVLVEHILRGLPVPPHANRLWKAPGTYCQMDQRKVILIYSLGQQWVWLLTSLNSCQHRLLSYLKFLANLPSRQKTASDSSAHLHFFNYLWDQKMSHANRSFVILVIALLTV